MGKVDWMGKVEWMGKVDWMGKETGCCRTGMVEGAMACR